MSIEINCCFMTKVVDQLGVRTSVAFFCEKKKRNVRTCSGCKSKMVEVCLVK